MSVIIIIILGCVIGSCEFSQIMSVCASKLSPMCKEWPGLPSTGGAGMERRTVRLLAKNATTAPHSTLCACVMCVYTHTHTCTKARTHTTHIYTTVHKKIRDQIIINE